MNVKVTWTGMYTDSALQYFDLKPMGTENYMCLSRRSTLCFLQKLSLDSAMLASLLGAPTPLYTVSNLQLFWFVVGGFFVWLLIGLVWFWVFLFFFFVILFFWILFRAGFDYCDFYHQRFFLLQVFSIQKAGCKKERTCIFCSLLLRLQFVFYQYG